MNPEIRRLQQLNNLIAETLDVISRQQVPMATAGIPTMGLSHSPYQMINPQFQVDPRFGMTVDPRFVTTGLTHTPYDARLDPRWNPNIQTGLMHTTYDPRMNPNMMNPVMSSGLMHTPFDPRLNPNVQMIPEFNVQSVPQYGLSHTPYLNPLNVPVPVDPRIQFATNWQNPWAC